MCKTLRFWFGQKLSEGSFLTTMGGTISYVSPEILSSEPYGFKVDAWSLGIVIYSMLVGYQPFCSSDGDQELLKRERIQKPLCLEEEYWDDISPDAKSLICNVLEKNPDKRSPISKLLDHHWFNSVLQTQVEDSHHVFFMIGSQ